MKQVGLAGQYVGTCIYRCKSLHNMCVISKSQKTFNWDNHKYSIILRAEGLKSLIQLPQMPYLSYPVNINVSKTSLALKPSVDKQQSLTSHTNLRHELVNFIIITESFY